MKSFLNKYEKYLVPATLLILLASYAVFALISEGTHGDADDIEQEALETLMYGPSL